MLSGYSYEDYLITFIDILGFKEMCGSPFEDEETQNLKCNEVLTQLHMLNFWLKEFEKDGVVKTIQFADTAIRMTRLEQKQDLLTVLKNEIQEVAKMQAMFSAGYGCLLRGSIVKGKLFYEEDPKLVCFGPAINRAYMLESSLAIFPRIILDSGTLPVKELSERDSFIRQDADGLLVLDYLREFEKSGHNLFCDHKNLVTSNLDKIGKSGNYNERLRQKYSWVKEYHNAFLKNKLPNLSRWIIE